MMTADERAEYDAERIHVSEEMEDMIIWRKRHQHDQDVVSLFDAQFKDVTDKRWVGLTISWMVKVNNMVESIMEELM